MMTDVLNDNGVTICIDNENKMCYLECYVGNGFSFDVELEIDALINYMKSKKYKSFDDIYVEDIVELKY